MNPAITNLQAPTAIKTALYDIISKLRRILKENLIGFYLHGSLAMGCFNPQSSDVDLLIVVREKMDINAKRELAQVMVKAGEKASFEISVITLVVLQHFTHPTPFEFHYSKMHHQAFIDGQIDFTKEDDDADLVAHIVMVKERGICLWGKPANKVFPKVPEKYFLDSLQKDFEWSLENVVKETNDQFGEVPTYAVLNSCRLLAYLQEKKLLSKKEGGEWALKKINSTFHPVIKAALKEYKKIGSAQRVQIKLLRKFMQYIQSYLT